MRYSIITLCGVALAGAAYAGETLSSASIERGRALSDWASTESMTDLMKPASPEFKAAVEKTGVGPAAMASSAREKIGSQTVVFDEFVSVLNGLTTYQRLSAYERMPAGHTFIAWNGAGVVEAAALQPASPPPAAVLAKDEIAVRLPFAKPEIGDWYTYWGGRNLARNYHMIAQDQTYAFDFVVVRNGRSFDGPATDPASYYCWGQPVLAPADGVVSEVVDGIADNIVGVFNPKQPAGNHVMIQHKADVYSLSGHLRNGTTTVKLGDKVKTGQTIGRCGNSGNTSEPHVHFHLQNKATFGSGATGLPALFRNASVDGRPIQSGEPIRGQIVVPLK